MFKLLLTYLLFFLFFGCNDRLIFSEVKTFKEGWKHDQKCSFEFYLDKKDSVNIFFNLRNNNSYRFSNIFLIAKLESNDKVIFNDTLEYAMADVNGQWLGKGFTSIKENKLWWVNNWNADNGNYKITVQHAMRKNGSIRKINKVEGVLNFGILVEEFYNYNKD